MGESYQYQWLWFFGSVGFAVLILACINFVNLSTAQSLSRAKEIGVRKSVGAGRFQLITQFLSEALMLVSFSAVLSSYHFKTFIALYK